MTGLLEKKEIYRTNDGAFPCAHCEGHWCPTLDLSDPQRPAMECGNCERKVVGINKEDVVASWNLANPIEKPSAQVTPGDVRDAQRYRALRLYVLHGHWPEALRGRAPGTISWGGTDAGEPYTGRVLDRLVDEILTSKISRSILDAAIAADSPKERALVLSTPSGWQGKEPWFQPGDLVVPDYPLWGQRLLCTVTEITDRGFKYKHSPISTGAPFWGTCDGGETFEPSHYRLVSP